MKKTFTLLIALLALSFSTWATTITWNADNGLTSIDLTEYTNNYFSGNGPYSYSPSPSSATIEGVTMAVSASNDGEYATFSTSDGNTGFSVHDGGKLIFSIENSQFLSIVINYDGENGWGYANDPTEWNSIDNTLTWSGSATNSVVLADAGGGNITSIVFTVPDAGPVSTPDPVTWNAENGLTSIYLSEYTNFVFGSGDPESFSSENYKSVTIEGVTATVSATADGSYANVSTYDSNTSISLENGATLTFSTELGQFKSIVINIDGYNASLSGSGWNSDFASEQHTITWLGSATNSVVLESAYIGGITSIVFTFASTSTPADPTPVYTTDITWTEEQVNTVSLSCSYVDEVMTMASAINGIKATLKKTGTSVGGGDVCRFSSKEIWIDANGELTFESSVGDIAGIEITCGQVWKDPSDFQLPTGWTYSSDDNATTFTWTGAPSSSVVFSGDVDFMVTSIKFSVVTDAPAPVSSDITWDLTDVQSVNLYKENGYGEPYTQTIKNITATAKAPQSGGYCSFSTYVDQQYNTSSTYISISQGGELVFAPGITKLLTNIVITCTDYVSASHLVTGSGWTYSNNQLKWSGNGAASVTLACDGSSDGIYLGGVTSIAYTVIDAPAPTILWEQRQINLVDLYCYGQGENPTTHVIKNIITSLKRTSDEGQWCGFWDGNIVISNNGTLKFKSIVGDITKIVITCSSVSHAEYLSTGWTYNDAANTLTWESTAAEEVSLSGNIGCDNITSIEFTYSPAPAPRLGEQFTGSYYHTYEITGAHTAKLPVQNMYGTLHITEYQDYEGVRYYITEIDDYALYGQDELPNAYIGENVARIGAHAFDGCIRMEECIIYSDVLDTIGEGAFKDCKIMAYIECPTEQPPVLGSNAFSGDNYLNHFYVESHVVNAYKAAPGWSAISSIIGAKGTTAAAGEIFFYRNQMTRGLYAVTVGATYSTDGEAKVMPYSGEVRSFYPIEYEGTLVISEEVRYMQKTYSITGIGQNAYKDSTRINVVLLPEAMKSIESGAFLNCTGVKNVIFLWDDPTTVTWADANKGLEFATAASGNTKIIVPEGKLAAYQAWAPAWAGCMIEGTLLDVTATADPQHSSRYYRTFYDSTTDYMMPPSVWAHAGYVRGNEFILRPVAYDGQILPKGTAVVLESETPDYRLIAIDGDAPAYTGPNDLIGTDVSFPRTDLGANADKVYVLGKQAGVGEDLKVGMGLYRYTGTNLGAHKAYMILDLSSAPESGEQGAPARFLFRHEDTATSFENVQKDNDLCTKILRDGQLIIIRDGKQYNAQGLIIK